jgi:hypothetical protein
MQRVMHRFPRQGDREPWLNPQTLRGDRRMFRRRVDDGVMQFTGSVARRPAPDADRADEESSLSVV